MNYALHMHMSLDELIDIILTKLGKEGIEILATYLLANSTKHRLGITSGETINWRVLEEDPYTTCEDILKSGLKIPVEKLNKVKKELIKKISSEFRELEMFDGRADTKEKIVDFFEGILDVGGGELEEYVHTTYRKTLYEFIEDVLTELTYTNMQNINNVNNYISMINFVLNDSNLQRIHTNNNSHNKKNFKEEATKLVNKAKEILNGKNNLSIEEKNILETLMREATTDLVAYAYLKILIAMHNNTDNNNNNNIDNYNNTDNYNNDIEEIINTFMNNKTNNEINRNKRAQESRKNKDNTDIDSLKEIVKNATKIKTTNTKITNNIDDIDESIDDDDIF